MHFVGTPPPDRRIIRLLGSGGMGVVYEALDVRLDRHVALKVLHPHLTMNEETRGRLLQEARLAARVEQDNIVRIYNVHAVDTGLCLEMQYIEGVSLSRLIADESLTPSRAVDLLRQVLEALAACHQKDVVHADLKPGNLIITQEGKVYLTDFGISRAIYSDSQRIADTLSFTGTLWGTPQYCPPEAWSGEMPSVGWDLYALGILVYEAMCGHLPFDVHTPALLMREKLDGKGRSIVDAPVRLSGELADLIDSLSAADPTHRPVSAESALKSLRNTPELTASDASTKPLRHSEVASGPSMPLPITSLTAPMNLPGRRRTPWFAGLFIVGLFGVAVMLYGRGRDLEATGPEIKPDGAVGEIRNLVAGDGFAAFSYDDGEFGREPWVADAQGRVTRVADINPGASSSNPREFLWRPTGDFIFAATNGTEGAEPWMLHPGRPSARLLKDIIPGPMYSRPAPVAAWDRFFYFYANSMTVLGGLWISDGVDVTTGLLREINPEAASLDNANARHFVDASSLCTLWEDKGRNFLVRYEFATGKISNYGQVSSDVHELVFLEERAIFSMVSPEVGFELWCSEPGFTTPQLLKDFWPGATTGKVEEFHVWKNAVYFRATTPEYGSELWKTDGTTSGTVLVHDLNTGIHDGSPSNFVGTDNLLFFRASSRESGLELWSTTGLPGSIPRVYDLRIGPPSSTPYSIAQIGNLLCFSADDGGSHGEEFWALDLSHSDNVPYEVKDIRSGPESSEPHNLRRLSENVGIFIYKTGTGDGLMRVVSNNNLIELSPYDALPR